MDEFFCVCLCVCGSVIFFFRHVSKHVICIVSVEAAEQSISIYHLNYMIIIRENSVVLKVI